MNIDDAAASLVGGLLQYLPKALILFNLATCFPVQLEYEIILL